MPIYTVTLKKHSEENLTNQFPDLNDCIVHHCKPEILRIVSGRHKDVDFIAVCKDDSCGKINYTAQKVVDSWNKWNPK